MVAAINDVQRAVMEADAVRVQELDFDITGTSSEDCLDASGFGIVAADRSIQVIGDVNTSFVIGTDMFGRTEGGLERRPILVSLFAAASNRLDRAVDSNHA